jgi:nucleoside-diphosphate-sugar epimerase
MKGEAMQYTSSPVHDWVYVKDFVNTMSHVAMYIQDYQRQKIHTIECGTGIEHSNEEILEFIEQITGKKANAKLNEQSRSFDTMHWAASHPDPRYISLVAGLKKYYDWYKKQTA